MSFRAIPVHGFARFLLTLFLNFLITTNLVAKDFDPTAVAIVGNQANFSALLDQVRQEQERWKNQLARPRYRVYEMSSLGRYWDREGPGTRVLSEEQLQEATLSFSKGLAFRKDRPGNTSRFTGSLFELWNGRWNYIMTEEGQIYVFSSAGGYKHSAALFGKSVAAAGQIRIVRGKIVAIDNLSGHYFPNAYALSQMIHQLQENGVNLTETLIEYYQGKKRFRVSLGESFPCATVYSKFQMLFWKP